MPEKEIRILIVEDDEGHAGLIRRAFAKADMTTRLTLVDSVHEAQTLLEREGFDLILADLVLPDGRGTKLLAAKQYQDWPVVIMTSHGDETAAVEAMKAGALDYLVKSQGALADLPRTSESILRRWNDIVQRRQAERALRDSEERFRLLYEASPLPYQSLDADGCLIEVNPAWTELLGYSKEEALGKRITSFLDEAGQRGFEKRFPRFLQAGEVRGADFVMIRKDGTCVPVEVDGRIGYDEYGRFKQTHCVVRDVTERVRVEEQRRRAHGELEKRVAKRTVQLADANRKLQQEVADRERTEATLRASLTLHDAAQTATSDEVIQWCLDEGVRLTESDIGFFHFVDAQQEEVRLFAWSTSTMRRCEVPNSTRTTLSNSQASGWMLCAVAALLFTTTTQVCPTKRDYPKATSQLCVNWLSPFSNTIASLPSSAWEIGMLTTKKSTSNSSPCWPRVHGPSSSECGPKRNSNSIVIILKNS